MDQIIEDFKSVQLTRIQKFLTILTIVLVILANTNIKPSDYHLYIQGGTVTDLYFATMFKSGDAISLVVFNQFIRLK